MQPCVQRRPQVRITQRRIGTAAFRVAAYDHLLDLQMRDSVLDNRGCTDVVGVHAVGDIAVYEQIPRLTVAYCRLRYSAVGAANP